MPNIRSKIWTTTTPAQVTDAQYWEDHLIDDASYQGLQDLLEGGGTGGGHIIVNSAGTDLPQEDRLQFINATVTDSNGKTVVTCGQGTPGEAATVTVGTTTTGAAGTNANVTNSGTSSAAVLDFVIPRGANGTNGTDGRGIVSILKTGTSGNVDTYTITYTDSTTSTFTVTNGTGAGDMTKAVYDQNDNGIVDNAEKVDGHTVARNVLANEYTNTQIDNKVSSVLPSSGSTGQYLQKTASGTQWADVEALPSGGTTGQVLTKTSTGADWEDVDGLPSGGTAGQVLTKVSSTDGDATWQTPGLTVINNSTSESTTVRTSEVTLLSITVPSAGTYLMLSSVTWSGSGNQNKDIFFRIRNHTNNDEELAKGFWYAGYQSQTGGAGMMTIYAVSQLSADDVINCTLRVSTNSVWTDGITSLTAIKLG